MTEIRRARGGAAIVAIGLCTWLAPAGIRGQDTCELRAPSRLDGPRLTTDDRGVLRTGSDHLGWGCISGDGPAPRDGGVDLDPVALRTEYRSAYPFDRNNGAVWSGRGLTASLSGGIRGGWNRFRVVFHPVLSFQQNQSFDLAVTGLQPNPMGAAYHALDWPQRFGAGAFTTIDAGQSVIGVTAGPIEAVFGTESLWWGPARRSPLLLSNTAPGFPHLGLGTPSPVSVGIGRIRANLIWGRLGESDYYDTVDNDDRLLTGFFLEFEPGFAPGLTLGLGGMKHSAWNADTDLLRDALSIPIGGDDETRSNGLLSVTGSWTHPEVGFDVYAEWAREDYWLDVEDLLTEPDHSQAFLVGFEKLIGGARPSLRLVGELAQIDPSAVGGRTRTVFYRNAVVRHGHTNRGQLLGSATGPSSHAQYLAVDLIRPTRIIGLYAERIRRDDATYDARFARRYGFRGHDLEWTLGSEGLENVGPLALRWELALSRRKNRSFIGLDGTSFDLRRETNAAVSLAATWLPGR